MQGKTLPCVIKVPVTPKFASFFGRDGCELRCTMLGAGPAVLLLHAGGERRQVWAPIAERLAARGLHTVSVDQRGHGETGGAVPDTLDPYASDVQMLVKHLNPPIALIGASLGGLALMLALADAKTAARIRAVVLVDVLPTLDPERARVYLRGLESERGMRLHWPLNENILGRLDQLQRATAELRVPVHVISGSRGNTDPVAFKSFLQLVPHATLRVIDGAGHLVARDRPAELAAVLLDCL